MEEVPSFIRRKEITDFADGLDELVEGSGTDASEVGLEPPGSPGSLVAPVCRQVVRNDP